MSRAKRKIPERLKPESENWDTGVVVPEFSKKQKAQVKLFSEKESNVLVFKMTDRGAQKIEWEMLSDGFQRAFMEVKNTFSTKTSDEDNEGCCSFAYSDEESDLSAVCFAKEGKVMLFYKEME